MLTLFGEIKMNYVHPPVSAKDFCNCVGWLKEASQKLECSFETARHRLYVAVMREMLTRNSTSPPEKFPVELTLVNYGNSYAVTVEDEKNYNAIYMLMSDCSLGTVTVEDEYMLMYSSEELEK